MVRLEFVKDDEKSYAARVTNGDAYDWEVAGTLVKDENGVWSFDYGDQSIEYEESLEEAEAELKEEFEDGKNDTMSHYFGNYKYNK